MTSSTHRSDCLSLDRLLPAEPNSVSPVSITISTHMVHYNAPSNTEAHASKNPTPPSRHAKTESQKIEFENLFLNLSLTTFKTVVDNLTIPQKISIPLLIKPQMPSRCIPAVRAAKLRLAKFSKRISNCVRFMAGVWRIRAPHHTLGNSARKIQV